MLMAFRSSSATSLCIVCVCGMGERDSHVSTYTTKDELDSVDGGGGGGCMGGRTFTCVYPHYQG